MSDARFDMVVIGGGIIGLSSAMALLQQFPDLRLLLIEKEGSLAQHQTGHNSGVIHSGIYYKPGSIKAQTCVTGRDAMVQFCVEHSIPYEICGKVIAATVPAEFPRLEELHRRGVANGIPGIRLLSGEQLREIEPHCAGIKGLFVPTTGITDYKAVSLKYAEIIVSRGGTVRTGCKALGIRRDGPVTAVETTAGVFQTRWLVNCAGLHSDRVSRLAGREADIRIVPFRGEYYDIVPARQYLVKSLIYPVPDPQFPFLGVHFTRGIHGGVHAGPNAVLALKREGYKRTDFSLRDAFAEVGYSGFWRMAAKHWQTGFGELYRSFNKRAFVKALQRLLPEIQADDLRDGGSGVRAQALQRDGSFVDDFQFARSENALHVCNVPSPAATASIPIGQAIAKMAQESFDITTVRSLPVATAN
jgi:L-2-hydroxyglutarate oxidase